MSENVTNHTDLGGTRNIPGNECRPLIDSATRHLFRKNASLPPALV